MSERVAANALVPILSVMFIVSPAVVSAEVFELAEGAASPVPPAQAGNRASRNAQTKPVSLFIVLPFIPLFYQHSVFFWAAVFVTHDVVFTVAAESV